MQRVVRSFGYVALVATPTALLSRAFLTSNSTSVAEFGFGGGLAFVGAVTVAVERGHVFDGVVKWTVDDTDLADVFSAVVAAGVTYWLSVHVGLGPVVASALVGLVAGLGLSEGDAAAYCGSFVGMASPAVFPSVPLVLVAGFVAGVAFVAARETFAGFGGKLGTLALFGCLTTGLATGADYAVGPVLTGTDAALAVPVAAVGAVTTADASERFGLGPVVSSALVGLLAGAVLPVAFSGVGGVLATVAFCSSFVGMSSNERLGNTVTVGFAGALCGVVFVAVAPAFAGAGGKLGTTAFVTCLGCFGAKRLHAARNASSR
ncbi:hypothetical protein [Halosimplex sp. J119]